MSTARKDHLQEIERRMQALWDEKRAYEVDAPISYENKEKFMCTFPYPYMNGKLHLGHAFSMTKAEFAARYQRMKGKKALFPFAFHCTGMPIQAAANKLRRELEEEREAVNFESVSVSIAKEEVDVTAKVGQFKGKKSKVVAKTGGMTTKNILLKTGIPEDEIALFVDPLHWLTYFPPLGMKDLKRFGVHVDWRRSFITTSVNPFYDKFIQWQFNTLRKRNYLGFGKRPTIFSITDGQACADHDRSEGEGVGPQEYTLIKLKVLSDFESYPTLKGKNVFLVAATLRPETMYGQTNCFVLPDGEYGAYEMIGDEVFVCSERSALNMSYQDLTLTNGVFNCLATFTGQELIGLPLKGPNSVYEVIYTLPLLTIKMSKGTGVVTSVPSDAPDDYAALRDLKNKPLLREKYNVKEHMVVPFDPVPIINIEEYGNLSAIYACDLLKIVSQNDTIKLQEAKEMVYLKGFYSGVMLMGSCKGLIVKDAKDIIRAEMIAKGEALKYYEPEKLVVSRSGDECVVAYVDQWFLKYGEESPEWQARVLEHVENRLNTYTDAAKKKFVETVGWLRSWACSRSFGLGTLLPWDKQFVIESLSDSTIYMAYYTIAHYLQGGVLDGSKVGPLGIEAGHLSDEVFDYIFLQGSYPKDCSISEASLALMRREFEFWYPMDLRVSGKDLIQNHLTMALYNHAAIWEDRKDLWPQSYFTNGHVMVDAMKMSKSTGNFLMLDECIDIWSTDVVRFVLADAGDSMLDSNYERANADKILNRLYSEDAFFLETSPSSTSPITFEDRPPTKLVDRIFLNDIYVCIQDAGKAYDEMMFQKALNASWFMMQKARDSYRAMCLKSNLLMCESVINIWKENQILLMTPIIPHWCENIWLNVLKKSHSVLDAKFPSLSSPTDNTLELASNFLNKTIKGFRETATKKPKKGEYIKPNQGFIYIAGEYPQFKKDVLLFLQSQLVDGSLPKTVQNSLKEFLNASPSLQTKFKESMQFAMFQIQQIPLVGAVEALALSTPFDEYAVLVECLTYLENELEMKIQIFKADECNSDPGKKLDMATPGKPSFYPHVC